MVKTDFVYIYVRCNIVNVYIKVTSNWISYKSFKTCFINICINTNYNEQHA